MNGIRVVFFCAIIATLCATLAVDAHAQTIFIVRHAERTGEPDPPLNADGLRRAESLAKLLASANVRHFYSSDRLRARQTAAPAAKAAGREVSVIPQSDFDALIRAIQSTATREESTLVVGHRATVPKIVRALGGGEITPLESGEHNRLVVLTLLPGEKKASVVTLRY